MGRRHGGRPSEVELRGFGGGGAGGVGAGLLQTGVGAAITERDPGWLLRKVLLILLLLFPFLSILPFILGLACVPSLQGQAAPFTQRGFGIPVLKENRCSGKCQKVTN